MSRPAFDNRRQDPGNYFLYRSIEATGVRVTEGRGLRVLFEKVDVAHFHWPDNVLKTQSWIVASFGVFAVGLLAFWTRLRGVKIVWTAHNMQSHEQNHPRLERWFWRIWWRMLDGVIFHSNAAQNTAKRNRWLSDQIESTVIPLPDLGQMYNIPTHRNRSANQTRIGFVGRIRKYKGVRELITAFREAKLGDVYLTVAGRPETEGIRDETENAAQGDGKINLLLRFLEDAEMIEHISTCDLIVIPFCSVTNSGSALLALACGVPVLVPRTDYFEELRSEVGREWVLLFDGTLNGTSLRSALSRSLESAPTRGLFPPFSNNRTLKSATAETIAFYRTVLSS